MAVPEQAERLREAHEQYDRYVRPLEAEHRGEYVAVAPDGTLLLASTLGEAVLKAEEQLGSGNFIFKIGDFVVGSWRTWR